MVLIFYSCEKQRQAIIQVQKFNDTQVDMQPQLDLPIILEICMLHLPCFRKQCFRGFVQFNLKKNIFYCLHQKIFVTFSVYLSNL